MLLSTGAGRTMTFVASAFLGFDGAALAAVDHANAGMGHAVAAVDR
jgi:hypothetical protein